MRCWSLRDTNDWPRDQPEGLDHRLRLAPILFPCARPKRPYTLPPLGGAPTQIGFVASSLGRRLLREVCFLIGADGQILWADASSSPVALPDGRARWEAIWSHRQRLVEIAHSHPIGPEAFSEEDHTTMVALDQALGRHLRYSVVAPGAMIAVTAPGPVERVSAEPWWASLLRLASGMEE